MAAAGLAAAAAVAGEDPDAAPWFADVTAEAGLAFVHDPGVEDGYFMPESIGSGAALLDYDGDGDLDLYLVNGARREGAGPPLVNRLFRREADGTYREVTAEAGVGDPGYGMGAAVGDVDGDGDADLYVTNFGPDALYRNRGDGTFTDATREAGIDNPAWGASAVFFDPDLDGDLDLYVANYVALDPEVVCTDAAGRPDYCGPDGFSGVADRLYRNAGDGTFTDVSTASGIARVAAKGLGVVSADLDGDGLPDLYVANDGEPNLLWINRGDGSFEDRALLLGAGVNELGRPEAGMGIALGDADGDGSPDLFVTHLRAETDTLYANAAAGGFRDATGASGLGGPGLAMTGFGTGFFDFDHDGDLDLAVAHGRVTRGPLLAGAPAGHWGDYAEPKLLFENDGRGRFRDVSAAAGPAFRGPENSRGLAFGDLDGDGDVDLLVANEGGPARILANRFPGRGGWLGVRAWEGTWGRDAVGAVVAAEVGGRRQVRLLAPGYSFLSSNEPRVHFGLGPADRVDELRVRWPAGGGLRLRNVPADRVIMVLRRCGAAPSPRPDGSPPPGAAAGRTERRYPAPAAAGRVRGLAAVPDRRPADGRSGLRLAGAAAQHPAATARAAAPGRAPATAARPAARVATPAAEAAPPELPDLSGAERRVRAKISAARRFVAANPASAHAWGVLAMSLDVHGFTLEALPCYERAAALDPAELRWPYYRAILLAAQGAPEASSAFAHAAAIGPGYALLWVRYGDALTAGGGAEAAAEAYARAAALDPGLSHAHLGLARLALAGGDLAAAREAVGRALAAAPRHSEAHGLLAEILRRQGETEEAAARLRLARELPAPTPLPDPVYGALAEEGVSSLWYRRRGRAHLERGEHQAAARELEEALALAPRAEVHDDLGLALQGLGRFAEAARQHRAALALRPDFPQALDHLGTALWELGDAEGAIAALEAALERAPGLVSAAVNLGTLYQRDGRRREAARTFRRGLDHAPGELRLASRLAWLLATAPEDELRDGPEAVRLAEAVCARTGHRLPEALDVLAAAQAEAGRFTEAAATARRAEELATAGGAAALGRQIAGRRVLYEEGRPYREEPGGPR